MISPTTPSEKRLKSPLYYLWTKWNQSPHDDKVQGNALSTPHKSPFVTPLEEVIHYNDHGLSIPNTVQLCFTEIMKRGLQTEGLFRLSGATSEVMQLQKAFTYQGEHVDLTAYDIHSITSFIKKYLHHLPNAVVPANKHDDFLGLASLSKDQAIPMLIDLIALLPDRHSHLIHAILSLASHIQHYAHINMMNPEALAVVLAPVCTGIEKTIQILPKKTSKRNKKQQQDQKHQHRPQRINTADIEQFIRTNARWTLLWKWMIEECDTFVSATSPPSLYLPHKDTITSIVGSPAPPPPIPSLLYCSSSLLASDHPGFYSHHPTSSMASLSSELPRLKSRPSSPSMFTLCQKSSHGFLRRLASVSSLR